MVFFFWVTSVMLCDGKTSHGVSGGRQPLAVAKADGCRDSSSIRWNEWMEAQWALGHTWNQSFFYERCHLFSKGCLVSIKRLSPFGWQASQAKIMATATWGCNISKRELRFASTCPGLAGFEVNMFSWVCCLFAIQKSNSFLCYTNLRCVPA